VVEGGGFGADEFGVQAELMPYNGPRPSEARRFAPWVVLASGLLAFSHIAQAFLNLIERHYQQQVVAGHPPEQSTIQDTISLIRGIGHVTTALSIAFLVTALLWASKRRNRARLAQFGETAVEPNLWNVSRLVYVMFWGALALSLVLSTWAKSGMHSPFRPSDFVHYRTALSGSNAMRAAMWVCYVVLVVKATKLQDRREALAPPPPPPALPPMPVPVESATAPPAMWPPPPPR
jgi:hypothetical protein